MSTPDFDAAVERAARAIFEMDFPFSSWNDTDDLADREHACKLARAALQASGWEEASMLLQEFANQPAGFTLASLCGSARAWVAQYTPEGK